MPGQGIIGGGRGDGFGVSVWDSAWYEKRDQGIMHGMSRLQPIIWQ